MNIHRNFLQTISPNLNQGNFNLTYMLNENVNSAYILVTKPFTNTAMNIPLNTLNNSQSIELQNLPSGVYNVQLFVDGSARNALSIQIIN